MARGCVESGSIFVPIRASAGEEVTRQAIPSTRVLASYFQARYDGLDRGSFYRNGEHELIAMLDGVPALYDAKGDY